MAKTAQFELPLVAPAQAQKHVTVNEALARLDAVAQLRVVASDVTTPPGSVADGASYLVPAGAGADWEGHAGEIAVFSNGGWVFLTPRAGWRAWDEGAAASLTCDGSGWVADALAVSPNGAGTRHRVIEFDHALVPGASNTTAIPVPDKAQVIGVTGRVVETISGAGLTGWRLGVAGSDNRYGSGLGLAENSYVVGLSGSPVTHYSDTPLLLSAEGGEFVSGFIRLAIHVVELEPPRPV